MESRINGGSGNSTHHYQQIQAEASTSSSFWQAPEPSRIFDELPEATIISVSRPDAADITPVLLSYTILFRYRQFKWQLVKKASQVFYLHFMLKKRAFVEEMHEKQEHVKEWLQNLGIGDLTALVHFDDEADDEVMPLSQQHHIHDESVKERDVPSSAALPVLRPALGTQEMTADSAKIAMQGYLNHFLGNITIVNSREVCKFLGVSKLSFLPEYGSKLQEDYVMVMHLPKISKDNDSRKCCLSDCFRCCNDNWQKVWAVLKPGFLALLADPFDVQPLDIIAFDVLPSSDGNEDRRQSLAQEMVDRNPLRHSFKPPEGWCHPHRYGSYAPPRGLIKDGSQAQWFIDGRAAFEAIASSIKDAKSEIFICGWWLCPELYLKRPFLAHAVSRLDNLLEERAKQGVQIFVLIYKEVALALKINSFYSRRKLLSIHENVRVLRFPDHFSTGVYLWESEPNSWEDVMKDELDRGKYPRMPWHDVHCALWGPPCRDIARHFVQRWNYAKRSKAPNEQAIPLLMPRHHMVIPHYLGKNTDVKSEYKNTDFNRMMRREDSFSSATDDIPLLLPQESGGLNASEEEPRSGSNSFSYLRDQTTSRLSSGLSFSLWKTKVEPISSDTPMKGFVDNLDAAQVHHQRKLSLERMALDRIVLGDVQNSDLDWYKRSGQGEHGGFAEDSGQVGPRVSCRCQVIRSVAQWSAGTSRTEESIHKAYCSLIEKAEHFIYIENQFFISGLSREDVIRNRVLEALYQRIMRAFNNKKTFRVIIVIPLLPGFQGGLDDSGAASVRAIMHWQYRTICRGQNSILHNLYELLGSKMHDYISFFGLRSFGRLGDNVPLVTSQVYVHSKIMIIDDCTCLIGSANINDRSLLGSRDSEIGVVIEDREMVDSYMDGKPWKAGKFSLTLRLSLWSEHLGLGAGESKQIMDPVVDSTYNDIWMARAKENTQIYQDVFSCVPNDAIHNR
ncbi:Phospholipase D zeta 1 [Stylosanthes scabra]|uniref:Phospholipase n=1 Tax=Stylosanthes scabra TaxID=79078 RepID=A0ABU6S2I9_9FABA|nr:Phospholipase D zeta 1 [Stylosanthes scabra]